MNRKNFDIEEFRNKVSLKWHDYEEELSYFAPYRAEPLLMVNYVESLLGDFIVLLTKSKEAGEISRRTINKILFDREIIDKVIFDDLKKKFQIRDLYTHNLSLSQVDKENNKIIETMSITQTLKEEIPNWQKIQIEDKVCHAARKIADELHDLLEESCKDKNKSGKEES